MRIFLAATVACLTSIVPAHAETTTRDMEVVGRTLSFIENASGNTRTVALVYDAGSETIAQALAADMAGGLSAGRVTITARLVPAGDLSGLAGAHAAFLLGDTANDTSVTDAALGAGVMSVSSDLSCAESGRCVMSVQSAPSVRILVNRSNADAASVSFAAAFAMMIEEI
jgi:hypothetical protein